MDFNQALQDYQSGEFTDQDVTRCAGLSERSWRELIKTGAVRTAGRRGRGQVRCCDANTFKRTALIAGLNRAGLSLAVSGQIAYLLPRDQFLYFTCDPVRSLLNSAGKRDPVTGLPPRLKLPKANWCDPDKPARANPKNDWLIEIYDGRFVGRIIGSKHAPLIYGDLRDQRTRFVLWRPFRACFDGPNETRHLEPWYVETEPRFSDADYEKHDADDDPLCRAAERAVRNPVFKTTINATLAIRMALRRYLGIEPAIPPSDIGET